MPNLGNDISFERLSKGSTKCRQQVIDYGLNHDLYFGDKTGKTRQVLGVNDLDFDNDKDEVTRDFIDGTNLKLIKSFK